MALARSRHYLEEYELVSNAARAIASSRWIVAGARSENLMGWGLRKTDGCRHRAVLDAWHSNGRCHGASMGGFLAVQLIMTRPHAYAVRSLPAGENYFHASAMGGKDRGGSLSPVRRDCRPAGARIPIFCERAGGDLVALAACIRRPRRS
jgi:hypothetical protein